MKLQEFLDKNKCTNEERQAVADYLMALRIMDAIPDLKQLYVKLKNIFKP